MSGEDKYKGDYNLQPQSFIKGYCWPLVSVTTRPSIVILRSRKAPLNSCLWPN